MARSLSDLVNIHAEGIYKCNLNVKMNMIIKNMNCVELNTKIVTALLNTQTLKMI